MLAFLLLSKINYLVHELLFTRQSVAERFMGRGGPRPTPKKQNKFFL